MNSLPNGGMRPSEAFDRTNSLNSIQSGNKHDINSSMLGFNA